MKIYEKSKRSSENYSHNKSPPEYSGGLLDFDMWVLFICTEANQLIHTRDPNENIDQHEEYGNRSE